MQTHPKGIQTRKHEGFWQFDLITDILAILVENLNSDLNSCRCNDFDIISTSKEVVKDGKYLIQKSPKKQGIYNYSSSRK